MSDPEVTSTSRLLRDDRYEDLGPEMRARLDRAEMDMARVRDYISIMAETEDGYRHARVLCLLLGLAQPKPMPYRQPRWTGNGLTLDDPA